MRIFGVLFLSFLSYFVFAQTTYGSLSGTVYHLDTKEPIQTQLQLFSSDSGYVSSVRSNDKGKFNLVGIKKGKYYFKAGANSNGGYALYYSGTIEVPKQSRINIPLQLNPIIETTEPIEKVIIHETINYNTGEDTTYISKTNSN